MAERQGAWRVARATSSVADQAVSTTSAGFGLGRWEATAVNTGHISFSTTPDASVARYRKSGRTSDRPVSSSPSSSKACRSTASDHSSPGAGCPQKVLVHTPGHVALLRALRVTSTSPAVFSTWHEKPRCNGVSALCTDRLG